MTPYVRSRKFCCCIPVRFGVFVLSLLGMGAGIVLAVFGWRSAFLIKQQDVPISKADQVALNFSAAMYAILALVSLFGFIGAIIRSIGMVAAFANALLIHLVFSVGVGIYAIYTVFKQDPRVVFDQCMSNVTSGGNYGHSICKDSFAILKGVTIGVHVVIWLLQLYAYFIVQRYVEQLEHEDDLKTKGVENHSISRPAPINVTTYSPFGSANQPRSAFVNGSTRA